MVGDGRPDATNLIREAFPDACRAAALHWIDGRWQPSESGDRFVTTDPTTARTLYEVASGGEADMTMAVAAAERAQPLWWRLDGQDRARVLRRIADGIRTHAGALGLLDTLDAGRPIRDTRLRDVERAARLFEYFAGTTDRLRGANIPVQPGRFNVTELEPFGVVGAIVPWNYPLTNAAVKIAPALATGNAVVLKPAEETPLSALLLAHVAQEAGLPAGLLNVVNGPGALTGEALVRARGVSKLSFTGSTEVGRRIGAICGETLKSVTLELGGKTAFVVFADADLERAADALVFSAFSNNGQTCTAASRLLLDCRIATCFLEATLTRLSRVKIGDPLESETLVGPLVSEQQLRRVQDYLEDGLAAGARVIEAPISQPRLDGFFFRPVIFRDVHPDMRVAREEIFGPLLSVIEFTEEDEAIAVANDSPYGLAAAVWTSDLGRAQRLGRTLQAGLVWINTAHSLHPGSPYGGLRQSGLGLEMGQEAVQQLMRTKSLWVEENWQSPWRDMR